jgi:hypothetical protein
VRESGRISPGALIFGAWAGARLVPGLFPNERPFAGEWAGRMAVALAQQRAGLKAESAQVEHAAVAVQMGTVLMFAKNARRGLVLVVICPGVSHGRHCTAVGEACAMAHRAVLDRCST